MKLYATITSERASKSQGGQKYVQANFTVDRTHVISLTLKAEGEDVEVWETPAKGPPILLKTIKGKRQTGDKKLLHQDMPMHVCKGDCDEEIK